MGSTATGATSTGPAPAKSPPKTATFTATARCSPVVAVRPRSTISVGQGAVSHEKVALADLKIRVTKVQQFQSLSNHFTRTHLTPTTGASFYAVTYRLMNAGSKPIRPAYYTLAFLLGDSANATWRTVDREASCGSASDAYSVESRLSFPELPLAPGKTVAVAAVYAAHPHGALTWISLAGASFALPSAKSVAAVG